MNVGRIVFGTGMDLFWLETLYQTQLRGQVWCFVFKTNLYLRMRVTTCREFRGWGPTVSVHKDCVAIGCFFTHFSCIQYKFVSAKCGRR